MITTRCLVPIWIGIAFQFTWNIVMMFFLGDNTAFGNWIYSRNCRYTFECGGSRVLLWIWIILFTATIVSGIYQVTRRKRCNSARSHGRC